MILAVPAYVAGVAAARRSTRRSRRSATRSPTPRRPRWRSATGAIRSRIRCSGTRLRRAARRATARCWPAPGSRRSGRPRARRATCCCAAFSAAAAIRIGSTPSDDELDRDRARRADASCWTSPATPLFTRLFRWTRQSPQYEVGHLQRVAAIERSPRVAFPGCSSPAAASAPSASPTASPTAATTAARAAAFVAPRTIVTTHTMIASHEIPSACGRA